MTEKETRAAFVRLIMGLIIKSFFLSFGVFGRMILPILAIMVISSIVWSFLNLITGGYASYLSGSITATFTSLFGIRVALSLMGDCRRTEYNILILYSALYGVFLFIAKSGAIMLSDVVAVIYTYWMLGEAISFGSFVKPEEALQVAFVLYAVSAKAIVLLTMYTAVHVVMAVPLASAARAAGRGAMGVDYFNGFGRSFIPLFCVFAVSFFLQFFFDLYTAIFVIIPLFISFISIVLTQSVPDFGLGTLIHGLFGSVGLLWLHSWIWAASAVALVESDQSSKPQRNTAPSEIAVTDLRSLRKSRE